MYFVECDDEAVGSLRERLGALGDSVVVMGGSGLYTVHVHTDTPDRAVEEAAPAGSPRDVRIASLDEQVACLGGEARALRVGEAWAVPGAARTALVAVVAGPGAARLFRSPGAEVVMAGRAAAEDVGAAVARTRAGGVLVLSGGVDVLEEAAPAATPGPVPVRVLSTGSVVEGLAAAAVVSADDPVEENAARAKEAARAVAVAVVAEPEPDAVVEAVRSLHREGSELVTLLAGRTVSDEDADRVAAAVREAFPSLEVEAHRGDQPDGAFQVGLE